MTKIENECCGCATESYPCLGNACPNRNVKHYYCDKCNGEFGPEELYISEDEKELCADCLLSNYDTVAQR